MHGMMKGRHYDSKNNHTSVHTLCNNNLALDLSQILGILRDLLLVMWCYFVIVQTYLNRHFMGAWCLFYFHGLRLEFLHTIRCTFVVTRVRYSQHGLSWLLVKQRELNIIHPPNLRTQLPDCLPLPWKGRGMHLMPTMVLTWLSPSSCPAKLDINLTWSH